MIHRIPLPEGFFNSAALHRKIFLLQSHRHLNIPGIGCSFISLII